MKQPAPPPWPLVLTVLLTVAVRFVFELGEVVLTVAEFVKVPAVVGVTMIVIVSVAPAASVPRLAVTVPPDCDVVPALDVAETKVMPAGSESVTTELDA